MDNNYHPKKWLPEIALQSTKCNYYQLLQCITYWHFFYQLGQKCKLFQFLLSLNSQRRLEYKENNTNTEVCPKSIGAMLEYWYIICVLFTSSGHTWQTSYTFMLFVQWLLSTDFSSGNSVFRRNNLFSSFLALLMMLLTCSMFAQVNVGSFFRDQYPIDTFCAAYGLSATNAQAF